jgi:two-component sensor histidine kinase
LRTRDNGTGFEVNGTSKRQGIGLVRRLVEQLRGTVTVDSDHGTVWTIRFPTPIAPASGG